LVDVHRGGSLRRVLGTRSLQADIRAFTYRSWLRLLWHWLLPRLTLALVLLTAAWTFLAVELLVIAVAGALSSAVLVRMAAMHATEQVSAHVLRAMPALAWRRLRAQVLAPWG